MKIRAAKSTPDPKRFPRSQEPEQADLGIPLDGGNADPVQHFREISGAFFTAFGDAGDLEPGRRVELLRIALATVGELLDQLRQWMTDEDLKLFGRRLKIGLPPGSNRIYRQRKG